MCHNCICLLLWGMSICEASTGIVVKTVETLVEPNASSVAGLLF